MFYSLSNILKTINNLFFILLKIRKYENRESSSVNSTTVSQYSCSKGIDKFEMKSFKLRS